MLLPPQTQTHRRYPPCWHDRRSNIRHELLQHTRRTILHNFKKLFLRHAAQHGCNLLPRLRIIICVFRQLIILQNNMFGHRQAFFLPLLCVALDHTHFITPIPMSKTANRFRLQFIFILTTFHLLVRRVNNVQKVLRLRRRRGARRRQGRQLRRRTKARKAQTSSFPASSCSRTP